MRGKSEESGWLSQSATMSVEAVGARNPRLGPRERPFAMVSLSGELLCVCIPDTCALRIHPQVLAWDQASLAMSLEAGSPGWTDARSWDCVSRLGPYHTAGCST